MSAETHLTLQDVIEGVGSILVGLHPEASTAHTFSSVVIDSREAVPGSLFVALKGEHTNGHNYLQDALERGARGVIVQWKPGMATEWTGKATMIVVQDSLTALQSLAAHWRRKHTLEVIGVTGSIGKTTTKELVASLLEQRFQVLKNEGNQNNEVGLPLSLLRLNASHKKAVLEMGMYALGEIRTLCQMAQPRIGVVTNVGPSHLERVGSLEHIAKAKAELVESLPHDGVAILNGDDKRVRAMSQRTPASVRFYGLRPEWDVWASEVKAHGLKGIDFVLHLQGQEHPVHLALLGVHSVYPALAASTVALENNLSAQEIVAGLEHARPGLRLVPRPGINGSTIIDDSYNASPASTIAALDLLSQLEGRKIAVLGDMLELGPYELAGHQQVGQRAAEVADLLITVGKRARTVAVTAQSLGFQEMYVCASNQDASDLLKAILQTGDHVLIKGSRGMAMEQIVEQVRG